MKTTIITKKGKQVINTEEFIPDMASNSSVIFKAVEHMFFDWYEHNSQGNSDISFCYEGECDELATHSKDGAIREGINNLIEYIEENKLKFITTKDFWKADIECAFEI